MIKSNSAQLQFIYIELKPNSRLKSSKTNANISN